MILNDKFGKCARVMKVATGFDKEKIMKVVGNYLLNLDFCQNIKVGIAKRIV